MIYLVSTDYGSNATIEKVGEEFFFTLLKEPEVSLDFPYDLIKEGLTKEELLEKYKDKAYLSITNKLINESEFRQLYKFVKVISVLEQDVVKFEPKIDLDEISNLVSSKIINSIGKFNSKLEVHQPDMPLFLYNDYHVLIDACTENLQEKYINDGWRVVCVCPQPDQRRPDYIIARHIK